MGTAQANSAFGLYPEYTDQYYVRRCESGDVGAALAATRTGEMAEWSKALPC